MSDPSVIDPTLLQQIGTGIGALVAGGIATWIGLRSANNSKNAESAAPQPNAVSPADARYFFDGPIGRVLEFLQGSYRNSVEIRQEMQRHHDEIRGDLGEIIDRLSNDRPTKRTRRHRRLPS